VSSERVVNRGAQLKERFDSAKTIPGTHSFRCFVPKSNGVVETILLSSSTHEVMRNSFDVLPPVFQTIDFQSLNDLDYVVFCWSDTWAIGQITSRTSKTSELAIISLMEPIGPSTNYKFPNVPVLFK
jgi:hypothetical protein